MNQGKVVCPYCGQHHDLGEPMCPWTGKALPQAGSLAAPTADHLDPALYPLVGTTVGGKYHVRAALGKGGMGTVYEGVNVQMGRVVALKVLHPKQLKKEEAVKRFYQEARAAGAIGHPNICEVYDIGTLENGCPYLVMERLVGVTLADRIARERMLPIDDVLDALADVLAGLVSAHAKGIVHRDIKPENVFLTQRPGYAPIAKLLDFGVSKILPAAQGTRDSDLDLTRAGMVMGTPFYMSPEQARGDRDLDARVDIYGCGVLLYEALTGKRPFEAKSYNVLLWQILTKAPKPVRELRPELPAAIVRVITRAMQRSREDRYESADAFIDALQEARLEPPSADIHPLPIAPPTERMTFDHDIPASEIPISVELPSEHLVTSSSNEVPASNRYQQPIRPRMPPSPVTELAALDGRVHVGHVRVRRSGFDDVPTEIDHHRDFAMSDEGDAATTLMNDAELVELARRTMDPTGQNPDRGGPVTTVRGSRAMAPEDDMFDDHGTEVTKKKDIPPERPPVFNDETVRMDRPEPAPRRTPKPHR